MLRWLKTAWRVLTAVLALAMPVYFTWWLRRRPFWRRHCRRCGADVTGGRGTCPACGERL